MPGFAKEREPLRKGQMALYHAAEPHPLRFCEGGRGMILGRRAPVCGGLRFAPGTLRVRRKPGDPPVLVADAARAKKTLGWAPKRAALETQIEDAWRWHLKHS